MCGLDVGQDHAAGVVGKDVRNVGAERAARHLRELANRLMASWWPWQSPVKPPGWATCQQVSSAGMASPVGMSPKLNAWYRRLSMKDLAVA